MARNLILCFDGTWNRALDPVTTAPAVNNTPEMAPVENPENTNVVKIKRLIEQTKGDQVLLYFNGVGTNWYDHIRGGVSGEGLSKRIKLAYYHLAENYSYGDRIWLFGFSRGAFTARSLAGLVRKCGVLRVANMQDVDGAYELYRRRDVTLDAPDVVQFRADCSAEVNIHFMGVWDTVGELGIPLPLFAGVDRALWGFHDTSLSAMVKNAYQALAIDEHRLQFAPSLWTSEPVPEQSMEQRWFVGAHSNVGGGYPDCCLSNITLAWMCQKAAECGLLLGKLSSDPENCLGLIRDSYGEFLGGLPKVDPPYFRPVQAGTYRQSIDPSVTLRAQRDASYRPANLQGYWSSWGIT